MRHRALGGEPERHARARTAAIEREHEARAARACRDSRATTDTVHDDSRAPSSASLRRWAARVPDQRAIAEQPEIALAIPVAQRAFERCRAILRPSEAAIRRAPADSPGRACVRVSASGEDVLTGLRHGLVEAATAIGKDRGNRACRGFRFRSLPFPRLLPRPRDRSLAHGACRARADARNARSSGLPCSAASFSTTGQHRIRSPVTGSSSDSAYANVSTLVE